MNPELPTTIGKYEYDADNSGDDHDYCEEAYFYEDGDYGIAIVRINPDDGYRLESQRWGDAVDDIIMSSVPIETYDTLHEAVTAAERVFGSIRGVIERLRLELKHAPR